MPSGHTVLADKHWDKTTNSFTDSWKQTIEDAAIAGQRHVISPWLDESLRKDYDGLISFLEVFNKCGEHCKKSGLQFGYHNHDFEFNNSLNGKTIYEIIFFFCPSFYCFLRNAFSRDALHPKYKFRLVRFRGKVFLIGISIGFGDSFI